MGRQGVMDSKKGKPMVKTTRWYLFIVPIRDTIRRRCQIADDDRQDRRDFSFAISMSRR
jgi:hypothetical protein